MCGGRERVAALLDRLRANDVDAADLARLPAFVHLTQASKVSKNKRKPKNQNDKTFENNEKSDLSKNDKKVKKHFSTNFLVARSSVTWIVLSISVFLGVVFYNQLHTHHGFTKFWLWWENVDLYAEQCTIEMPAVVQDMFRPPVDCGMCRNVSCVDKVQSIRPEYFEERYAYSGRPVVISDGQKNWTAPNVFSFEYFKSIYSDDSPVLENFERDCQFFPYQTEFRNLGQVFNMTKERSRSPWYIGWSNCDSSAANRLRQHYERPYFLPKAAEASKTDWIFMGTPGYGAHLHIDHVGNPSWQAQIRGRKLWTLEPPPECHFECGGMEVTVEPGEIIVLDTNMWYHKTKIVSEDVSITIGSEYD